MKFPWCKKDQALVHKQEQKRWYPAFRKELVTKYTSDLYCSFPGSKSEYEQYVKVETSGMYVILDGVKCYEVREWVSSYEEGHYKTTWVPTTELQFPENEVSLIPYNGI